MFKIFISHFLIGGLFKNFTINGLRQNVSRGGDSLHLMKNCTRLILIVSNSYKC